jgi:hypothetical protein
VDFFTGRGLKGAEDREAVDTFAAAIERALRCLKL